MDIFVTGPTVIDSLKYILALSGKNLQFIKIHLIYLEKKFILKNAVVNS